MRKFYGRRHILDNRKVQNDLSALVGTALHLDLAAMDLDDILHNSKPQTAQTFIRMGTEERLTDPCQ